MDLKKIKGIEYYIYDNMEEFKAFNSKGIVTGTWREGKEGDYVYTDDEYILKILKKSKIAHPGYKKPRTYVRTICGSFIVEQKSHRILGENGVAENIYAFSGNNDSKKDYQSSRKLKSREFLFARYVAEGSDVISAFKEAFPRATKNRYIAQKASTLMNKEEVKTMISEEKKKVLAEEGVDAGYIIGRLKDIADISESDANKLRSLDYLAKISGLYEVETKKEQLAVFQGFTPEQLENLNGQKTKLVATGEKESD